jgi:hypothetical protein
MTQTQGGPNAAVKALDDITAGRMRLASDLEQLPWSHFVTLTFATDPSGPGARGADERVGQWLRRVNMRVPGGVDFFWVAEEGDLFGRTHVHVVTTGTTGITCAELARFWYAGRADVRKYDAKKGAIWYMLKKVFVCNTVFEMSARLWKRIREAA